VKQDTIAIFDIGKTNKKLFVFDEQLNIILEQSSQFDETTDEDGFACEDLDALTIWIKQGVENVINSQSFNITGFNVSAYGASFVNINENYEPVTPLYNYLKPFPENLKQQFFDCYGGEKQWAKETASPVLGNLNSGMQLYRLKYKKPPAFDAIKYSLHLPQFISLLISSVAAADITSIGCHTGLWSFQNNKYHQWVYEEGLHKKFPAVYNGDKTFETSVLNKQLTCGIGLHDSSAALIPYLKTFSEPFVLLSTGTWSITLNPFNNTPLTNEELALDCLCYLTYDGKPVKASRLFSGYEHEEQIKRLAEHFNKEVNYFKSIAYNPDVLPANPELLLQKRNFDLMSRSVFGERNLDDFKNYAEAYHVFISDIVFQQVLSTNIVLQQNIVKQIFVDGGFSKNDVYMNLLANAYPQMQVYAASVGQASALGAAMALQTAVPGNSLIKLKPYKGKGR
jgi:sugar (pentulose or hexulose) kinase